MPLVVRAHLAGGVAQGAPWGIALDGLLASAMWQETKASAIAAGQGYARAMEVDDPPDLDLPLARCRAGNGAWHWAATCLWPGAEAQTDAHVWMGKLDHRDLEHVADRLPKIISGRQGRFRGRRMPVLVTSTPQVTWRAVGDPDRIAELLEPVRSIGKKRGSGEGHVLSWEISAAPELDPLAAGHLHPDGTLGRTTPKACVRRLEQAGCPPTVDGGTGLAGLRPPYMHPARQTRLRLPALLDG